MAIHVPALLREFANESSTLEQEVEDLLALAECGLPVARIVVVPPPAEAEFYRLNNLGIRLREHFEKVNLEDPDDEDIEDLSPGAEALVYGHYLLDEFIDGFYGAIEGLPHELRVRRPGDDGISVKGSRASLLALKRAWSGDWSFEALWSRLAGGGPLLPRPRPLLLHAAPLEPLPVELASDASALLGRQLDLFGHPSTGISRIVPAAR